MIVTLPLPPTANFYFRIWRGRAVTSEEARAYKRTAALSAKAQGLRPIIDGEVSVSLRVFRPTMRGDLDNRLKVLLDALRGIGYRDDSQIARIDAVQTVDAKHPRVEVEIARLGAPPKPANGPAVLSGNWKPSAA